MAKRPKRRPFFRPRPQRRAESAGEDQRRLDAAARSLLDSLTPEQLSRELAAREQELAEVDQLAQLDPSPENLSRFRRARSQYETARAAAAILDGSARGGS